MAPFVMTIEYVGPDYAGICSLLINFPFVAGELLLVLVAYYFRDWRQMMKVAFIPSFAVVLLWFLVPESPRWLLASGKDEEARKIIKSGAKANGKPISDKRLEELMKLSKTQDNTEEAEEKPSLLDLHKNDCMRKRLIIMYINYIAVVLCYNGLTLNRYDFIA